ncbi:MAG: serine/threonine-protein kinase [Polyangia bacterium]
MSQEQNEAEKLVGKVLANTYRLEQLLVSGGMGAVFRARHIRTGGVCAIKVLHSRSAQNADIFERFQDEARIISGLRHPNIVQVTDLDQDASGLSFIVMELLEGEDLQDRLEREGKQPLNKALEITRQIGSALHAAHCKGVIHRDLKPRNIFLARYEVNGEMVEVAKVIDFGVSKIPRPSDRATRDLLVLGTPRYMAPEGAMGQNSQIDGRSDQWSVAVILYRLLSGRLPFDQENVIDLFKQVINDEPTPIEQLSPGLPRHIADAIKRAMRKKKEDRFPTMLDFLEALEPPNKRKRRPQSQSAMPAGAARRMLRRNLLFAGLGAVMSLAVLIPLWRHQAKLKRTSGQGSELLSQADLDLAEERWDDAAMRAERVLNMPGQPPAMRQAAEVTKRRAESGRQAQGVTKKLIDALLAKDLDTAVGINRDMPPNISVRVTAQQLYDLLLPAMVGDHLQKAEAARALGNCPEVQRHVNQVLRLSPADLDALQSRWRPCVSYKDVKAPGPRRLAGYPPARDADGTSLDLPGDYLGGRSTLADVDRLLREAQIAHEAGQYWRAATLAHAAVGTPLRAPTAWRIIGISACNLRDRALLAIAGEHLDELSREFVRAGCQTAGFPATGL